MLYLKWVCLIPVSLVMAIVGRVLAPVLPFFVRADGYLPRWLWWFQTPDNPCDGDKGHWERWPDTSAWGTYKRRVAWFLRNVAYGFDIGVLGQTRLSRRKAGLLAPLCHPAVELTAVEVPAHFNGMEALQL